MSLNVQKMASTVRRQRRRALWIVLVRVHVFRALNRRAEARERVSDDTQSPPSLTLPARQPGAEDIELNGIAVRPCGRPEQAVRGARG